MSNVCSNQYRTDYLLGTAFWSLFADTRGDCTKFGRNMPVSLRDYLNYYFFLPCQGANGELILPYQEDKQFVLVFC